MTYNITYSFLDKDKKEIIKFENQACFGNVDNHYSKYKNNVYFKYKYKNAVYFKYIVNSRLSLEDSIKYIQFLNSIKWFYSINVNQFRKDQSYIFKIKDKDSFKTFATLTALRYLDENHIAVKHILKNLNNKKISKMKLLLYFGSKYTTNTGHALNKSPKIAEEFFKFKLKKYKTVKDDLVVKSGKLNDFFSTPSVYWSPQPEVSTAIENYYGLK